MKTPGTFVTSVTKACDKSICPKTAFTVLQGWFLEGIWTFVTFVTVSRGSIFTMEYISIERVTPLVLSPDVCDKSDKSPCNAKSSVLTLSRVILGNTFVTQTCDKRCDRSDRSPRSPVTSPLEANVIPPESVRCPRSVLWLS